MAVFGIGLALWIGLQDPDDAAATPHRSHSTSVATPEPPHPSAADPVQREDSRTESPQHDTPKDNPIASTPTRAAEPVGEATVGSAQQPAAQNNGGAAQTDTHTPSLEDRGAEPGPSGEPALPEKRDTFLVIGDSQVQGGFGQALDYMLRASYPNSVVSTYGICSSSPMSWTNGKRHTCGMLKRPESFEPLLDSKGEGVNYKPVRTPRLMWLMHSHRPDVLIIGLGENGKKAGEEFTRLAVATLIRYVDCYRAGLLTRAACSKAEPKALLAARANPKLELQCFWVLPPLTRKGQTPEGLQTYLSWFTETIGDSCQLVDSRPLTCITGLRDPSHVCERDNAGIHFSPRRARLWAFATFDTIMGRLGVELPPERFRREVIAAWGLGI
ncbi:MAG: hypothetical protein AAFS10_02270 [Myxococcota bacterium]